MRLTAVFVKREVTASLKITFLQDLSKSGAAVAVGLRNLEAATVLCYCW
jgi:hypothetical protein